MRHCGIETPPAQVTLRAYLPAPARVELVYRPAPGRALRTLAFLAVFWGAIPFLMWLPPHYPWVIGAFVAGLYLAHREWHGRYRVRTFAGLCPRCGHPLSLGFDRVISFPHTLTCFHCHFEPLLEVSFQRAAAEPLSAALEHRTPHCVGSWSVRWLADEAYQVCDRCNAHCPATPEARHAAERENESGLLLAQLAEEGKPLI